VFQVDLNGHNFGKARPRNSSLSCQTTLLSPLHRPRRAPHCQQRRIHRHPFALLLSRCAAVSPSLPRQRLACPPTDFPPLHPRPTLSRSFLETRPDNACDTCNALIDPRLRFFALCIVVFPRQLESRYGDPAPVDPATDCASSHLAIPPNEDPPTLHAQRGMS